MKREIDLTRRDERETCFKPRREGEIKNDRKECPELQ